MRRSVKGVYDNVGWLAYFRKRFRSILRLDGIAFPAYNPKIYSSKVFGHLVVFTETREVTGSNLSCLVSNMSPYTSFFDNATCNTNMPCSACDFNTHSGTMSHSKVSNRVNRVKLSLSIPEPLFDATNGVTMRMNPRSSM